MCRTNGRPWSLEDRSKHIIQKQAYIQYKHTLTANETQIRSRNNWVWVHWRVETGRGLTLTTNFSWNPKAGLMCVCVCVPHDSKPACRPQHGSNPDFTTQMRTWITEMGRGGIHRSRSSVEPGFQTRWYQNWTTSDSEPDPVLRIWDKSKQKRVDQGVEPPN